jgi:hypothetical protein
LVQEGSFSRVCISFWLLLWELLCDLRLLLWLLLPASHAHTLSKVVGGKGTYVGHFTAVPCLRLQAAPV